MTTPPMIEMYRYNLGNEILIIERCFRKTKFRSFVISVSPDQPGQTCSLIWLRTVAYQSQTSGKLYTIRII